MNKIFVFMFIIMFSFSAYGSDECKYNLNITENDDILQSLFNDKNYSYKNANGNMCFNSEEGTVLKLTLKNGKMLGDIMFTVFYEQNKPMLQIYFSDYSILDKFNEFVTQENGNLDLEFLKDKKINIKYTFFYENGNPHWNTSIINGNGNMISYKENGAMDIFRPIKNYQINGTAEVYSENGRLWATLNYKDGEIISAKCTNERKNGSEWTKAEISNWEQGLAVDCNYF